MRNLLLISLLYAALPASACGLDGAIDNPFVTRYPGSFGVAVVTQSATASGTLPALPEADDEALHERLEARLDDLRSRLERRGLSGSFSLLVVESSHWARFQARGKQVRIESHSAPSVDEPVLLTSEPALAALLDGSLSSDAALQFGLLRWSGKPNPDVSKALPLALADRAAACCTVGQLALHANRPTDLAGHSVVSLSGE